MSLSQETLMSLMSLADGELEGDALVRAERLVAESEEARRALDRFRAPHVGIWLSESFDQRADAVGIDRIADAVVGQLLAAPPASINVARIDRKRSSRGALLVASVLGVTAIAAGVALFIKSSAKPSDQMPVASVGMPSVDTQPPGTAGAQGVEVDEVDSPSRGISVFEIPLPPLTGAAANVASARSGSSVVVWIDDEAAK